MSWIEPIIDRTEGDLLARTEKAFFNVADWIRIYSNTLEVRDQINTTFAPDLLTTEDSEDLALDIPEQFDVTPLILLNSPASQDIPLIALTAPTLTTFPGVDEINALIENIERLRLAVRLPVATGIVALKHDYIAGSGAVAPNYQAVNAWEQNLKLIRELLPAAIQYRVSCGVAGCGQPRFWQARFR